jgi:uncharacterized membrane protein
MSWLGEFVSLEFGLVNVVIGYQLYCCYHRRLCGSVVKAVVVDVCVVVLFVFEY